MASLTIAERALNWAKVLAVAVPACVAGYAAFLKGEPGAELGYSALVEEVERVRAEMETRSSFWKGVARGRKEAKERMVAREQLMKEIAKMVAEEVAKQQKSQRPPTSRRPAVAAVPAPAPAPQPTSAPAVKPTPPAAQSVQAMPRLPRTLEKLKAARGF